MMRIKYIILFFVFVTLSLSSFAHSGGTDARGGHHNRKTGGYHYHNSGRSHAADNPYQNHNLCGICNAVTNKDKIAFVQKVLKEKKLYPGEVTGIIDDLTIAAVKKSQLDYDISTTGIITQYLVEMLSK